MRTPRVIPRLLLASYLSLTALHTSAEASPIRFPQFPGFFSPVVTDEGDTTTNVTALSATWTGPIFFERLGGVDKYEYSIRRDRRDGPIVVPWISVGRERGVTHRGLALSVGVRYYFAVRASHRSGRVSAIGYSDGIEVVAPSNADDARPLGIVWVSKIQTGRQASVSVTMSNTGTTTWTVTASPPYALGAYPSGDATWGLSSVPLQEANVAPGQAATFRFFITAPTAPGTYPFQWRMRRGDSAWFGEVASTTIVVEPNPLQAKDIRVTETTPTSAVVTWRTDQPAYSQVDYGLTDRYGVSLGDAVLTTSHRVPLTGLRAVTTYHFRVRSSDVVGNATMSEDQTFQTPPFTAPSLGVEHFEFEGVILAAWWFDEYDGAQADQAIYQAAATGADWVGLIATWYMDTTSQAGAASTSNVIYRHPQKTPTDESLIHAIRLAKQLKRKVFLKLHLNVVLNNQPFGAWQDTWAGDIQPANRQAWFDSYTAYAQHYAALAKAEGVDLFGFGTELPTMTNPNEPSGQGVLNVQGWTRVIAAIRQNYTGKLTFSADKKEFRWIPFWSTCDYLGLDAYPSLTPPNVQRPGVDRLISGWWKNTEDPTEQRIDIPTVAQWSKDNGNKPVLFTELGYRSISDCASRLWETGRSGVFDETCQKGAYDAVFLALQKQPWFAGMFWWNWLPKSDADIKQTERTGYTPQGKLAQDSLVNFFLGVEPSAIASIQLVDQDRADLGEVIETPAGEPRHLYAVAKNASGQILGFAPSAWTVSGSRAETFTNDVGFARVVPSEAGQIRVIVQEPSTRFSDVVTLQVTPALPGLRVPSIKYPTIQSAIDAARAGDTIIVAPGTYRESIQVSSGVKLVSEQGPLVTIIDASGYDVGVSGEGRVEGFTIRNAKGAGFGESHSGYRMEIVNNIIEGNKQSGINIYGGRDILIANNIIRNNTTSEHGAGIRLDFVTGEIRNNVIVDNRALELAQRYPKGGGIAVFEGSQVVIRNNIIANNQADFRAGGVFVGEAATVYPGYVVEYNDIWGNRSGPDESNIRPDALGPGSLSVDPMFVNLQAGDYHLKPASPCLNSGHPDQKYNDKDGTRNDMGIYGGPSPFPQ